MSLPDWLENLVLTPEHIFLLPRWWLLVPGRSRMSIAQRADFAGWGLTGWGSSTNINKLLADYQTSLGT